MRIATSRFGTVEVAAADVIHFAAGLPGLEGGSDWVLLADAENDVLGWLQSVSHAETALAVVSPRHFVADYQARISRGELSALELEDADSAHVLVIVSSGPRGITLNLKAPLMINFARRLGRQVVAVGDLPLQHVLGCDAQPMRKAA
jgi:flagellar assembly factor FliW